MTTSRTCPACGETLTAHPKNIARRLRTHLARNCGPRQYTPPSRAAVDAARERNVAAADRGWRDRVEAAGYRTPSAADWVAHPTALDDLLRHLGGTSLHVIDGERRELARRRVA